MTTYTIYTSAPDAGLTKTGQAARADSGLRIDATVQGLTGVTGSLLDNIVGSTDAIKISKLLGHLQRRDGKGLEYSASSDGATFIAALL